MHSMLDAQRHAVMILSLGELTMRGGWRGVGEVERGFLRGGGWFFSRHSVRENYTDSHHLLRLDLEKDICKKN